MATHLAAFTFIASTLLMNEIGSMARLPDDFSGSVLSLLAEHRFALMLVLALATLNGLFHYLLRAPTAAGRAVMDQIDGLALYLRIAETPRLNVGEAPELDTDRFERLLPYAVALGLEKPWSEAFERAFARSHPGVSPTDAYRPAWRSGRAWTQRNLGSAIAGSMASTLGSFASASPPPKSSSGFGGGGGSGRGGGGGGGGGW
jgi:uncharacterized membrane protein YgcG